MRDRVRQALTVFGPPSPAAGAEAGAATGGATWAFAFPSRWPQNEIDSEYEPHKSNTSTVF